MGKEYEEEERGTGINGNIRTKNSWGEELSEKVNMAYKSISLT